MRLIGLLGGTFDPVHIGHLRLAIELRRHVDEVRLIPASNPPHRHPPEASSEDRLALLETAVAELDRCHVDDIEYQRPGPSYMVDTLAALRQNHSNDRLALILGEDAFNGLDRWHRWQQIFQYAHLIVCPRPGNSAPVTPPSARLQQACEARYVSEYQALKDTPAGLILREQTPMIDISASALRAKCAAGESLKYLVPDSVLKQIQARRLYKNTT